MDKYPNLIPYKNVSDSIFLKVNGNILKKRNNLLQILLWNLHNHLILPVTQGGFHGVRNEYGRVCIGDTSLRKYTPKQINPMINRNNITRGCETCISVMLLKSNLNKWWLTQL